MTNWSACYGGVVGWWRGGMVGWWSVGVVEWWDVGVVVCLDVWRTVGVVVVVRLGVWCDGGAGGGPGSVGGTLVDGRFTCGKSCPMEV